MSGAYQPRPRFRETRVLCECGSIWHLSGECDTSADDGSYVAINWPCADCAGQFSVSIPSNARRETIVAEKWRGVPFVTLNLKNDTDDEVQLCIEPEASEYPIPPRTTYALRIMGVPHIDGPTIEVSSRRITVWPEAYGFELRDGDGLIDEGPSTGWISNRSGLIAYLDRHPSQNELEVFVVSKRHLIAAVDAIGFDHWHAAEGEVLGWIRDALRQHDSESALWGLVCIDVLYGSLLGDRDRHWDELLARDPSNARYAVEAVYWLYALCGADGGSRLAAILNRHDCWDAASAYLPRQDEERFRSWWRRSVLPRREPGSA